MNPGSRQALGRNSKSVKLQLHEEVVFRIRRVGFCQETMQQAMRTLRKFLRFRILILDCGKTIELQDYLATWRNDYMM